jgi:hypothetical protein
MFDEISRDDIKEDKRREFNKRQKTLMKVVSENVASYALLLILALLIGFIWTDIGIFISFDRFIGDALVTVILYILADLFASYNGAKGGRLDDEYITVHKEYLTLRETVIKAGITLMDTFCDLQIEREYELYLKQRCRELEIEYKTYLDEYRGKSLEELNTLLPGDVAVKVFALNQTKRIELTSDMLLTDGKSKRERGGLPVSGQEYIERHTVGWQHIIMTALFAIVAAVPTFSMAREVSLGMVLYTLFKITLMLYRMYMGFSRGAKGYNTVEVVYLQAKIKYLNLYLEYLRNATNEVKKIDAVEKVITE